MDRSTNTPSLATALTVAATILIWSTTFASLRAALEHFEPGHLVFLRWTITAVGMVLFGAATGMRLPKRADVGRVLLAGLLGFGFYQIVLAIGQQGVTAGTAGFLINMSPLITTVLAVTLHGENTSRWTWAGLVVSLAGMAIMGASRGGFAGAGGSALLVLAAAASFSAYSLTIRPLLARYRPLEVTTWAIVSGVAPFVVFAPGSLQALRSAPPEGIATLLYMAIVPGWIGYVLWSRVNAALSPGVAARFLYAIPVVGLGTAWVWLGEVPQMMPVLGGLLTLAGVALATRRSPVGISAPGAPRPRRVSLLTSQPNMRRQVPAEETAA